MRARYGLWLLAMLSACSAVPGAGGPSQFMPDGAGDAALMLDSGSADAATADAHRDAAGMDAATGDDAAVVVTPGDAGSDSGSDGRTDAGSDAGTDAGNVVPLPCDEGLSGTDCSGRTADYGRRIKIMENLADPDVIALADDRYVLSGTGSGVDFPLLESSDLISWTRVGTYNPSSADPNHDYCFCWAPDIVRVDGTLYFYFSAHRGPKGGTSCPPPQGFDVTTYRAASTNGSLAFGVPELLFQGLGGAQSRTQSGCPGGGCGLAIRIDPTVYSGRLYYVYFDSGNNIGSVALNNSSDFRAHAGPADWTLSAFEEAINEGPELLERNGRAYMFLSAAWFDSQYATFYVMGDSVAALNRNLPLRRLTTPVRRGNGSLAETHGHNSVATRRGETFNFFHVGVFNTGGGLIRRDTYRQRIAWNPDGTAMSQNQVQVSWNQLGGGNSYSLDLVLRDGSTVGPCIAVGRIGQSTATTFTGICPDAADRLVHKSLVAAFRLYASSGGPFMQVGETPYDGYSDTSTIVASPP